MKDLVTDLREDRGSYCVVVNDAETFRLTPAEYREFPLRAGDPIDWEAFKHTLLLRQYPEALNRAVALLATRARSRREVERKLMEKGYFADTIEMVLYKLEKENLLDDAAFAKAWVESRAARGLGKARLLQELRVKGVADDIAQTALIALDGDEQDMQAVKQAVKALRHYGKLPARDAMQKALAALLRRGYRYGEASRALQAAIEQKKEE